MMLKDGDKKSDVYSLGRLLNFIMTKDPYNNHHSLRSVTEKATSQNSAFRFNDAGDLLKFIEKSYKYHEDIRNSEIINRKAYNGTLDTDVENYIYELSGEKLCLSIIESNKFIDTLLQFMRLNDERAIHIIQSVEENYRDACQNWTDYDSIAQLSNEILLEKFSYIVKERAACIMSNIAYGVNRFNVRDLIKDLINHGVEPMIEDILSAI